VHRLHGANRLASNSLLEGLVFGHRAARDVVDRLRTDARQPPVVRPWDPGRATDSNELVVVAQNWDEIRASCGTTSASSGATAASSARASASRSSRKRSAPTTGTSC
jgi:aspartate oxidase